MIKKLKMIKLNVTNKYEINTNFQVYLRNKTTFNIMGAAAAAANLL